MIRIILSITLFLLSISLFAQKNTSVKGISLTIEVNNFSNNNGKAIISLFNEKGFLEKPIQKIETEIVDGKIKTTFNNVQKGTYSVICHHDSNTNGKLDFNEMGIPLEDIGVSNCSINFGPPSFKKSKFEVFDNNITLEIKL